MGTFVNVGCIHVGTLLSSIKLLLSLFGIQNLTLAYFKFSFNCSFKVLHNKFLCHIIISRQCSFQTDIRAMITSYYFFQSDPDSVVIRQLCKVTFLDTKIWVKLGKLSVKRNHNHSETKLQVVKCTGFYLRYNKCKIDDFKQFLYQNLTRITIIIKHIRNGLGHNINFWSVIIVNLNILP